MSFSPPSGVVCAKCSARVETTASADFGCLACWLQAGLEESSQVAAEEHEQVPKSLGSYFILKQPDGSPWALGRGAMGVTYRAEDVSLRRPVALKLINADFAQHGAGARERFVREARAAASLRHPNVATVYQFGIDEETGQCFCAMELIEGETLDERVPSRGKSRPRFWSRRSRASSIAT
ncbi:MAG: hypothetical protein H0X40_01000 [Chthoniobacterales bacterium]|nr:hypothetical protein [Chthoniobacterales bacterium]